MGQNEPKNKKNNKQKKTKKVKPKDEIKADGEKETKDDGDADAMVEKVEEVAATIETTKNDETEN